MIFRRLAGAASAIALLLPGAAAVAQSSRPTMPVAAALAEAATGPCVDLASQSVAWPADTAAQTSLLASYGLEEGLPSEAMAGMGPQATTLLSRATLAHREGIDGGFVLAWGGAQPLCRLILYRADDAASTRTTLLALLVRPASGWKAAPAPSRGAVEKLMFVRRTPSGKPILLNVLSPVDPASRPSLILTVAAIPPNVTLPQGL